MIGPLIAALGFGWFAVPSIGESYWKTFLPAIVVLGFGMAVTVAPLTTVVMNSVSHERVGTASGINNAVARVAGVLAIAVLGIVMVTVFSSRLSRSLGQLSLPPAVVQEIQANEIQLAGLQVPAGLNPSMKSAVEDSVKEAFIFGFRTVMLTCACLALIGAAVTWLMIPRDPDRRARAATEAHAEL